MMQQAQWQNPEKHASRRFDLNFRLYQQAMGEHELDFGTEFYDQTYNPGQTVGVQGTAVRLGGHYLNRATGEFLFPTLIHPAYYGTKQVDIMGQNLPGWPDRGPAAIMQTTLVNTGDNVNKSRALYLNDNWKINEHWVVMAGLRWNRSVVTDMDETSLATRSYIEPRFQLRWDPAGDGKGLVTFSASRFASEFSTALTGVPTGSTSAVGGGGFTTSPWNLWVMRGWKGIGNQAIPGTAGDLVDGRQMYGVRWITYDQAIDPRNYGAPFKYQDPRAQKIAGGLSVPFSDEASLGYRRNYEDGWFAVNYVHRVYKDAWVTTGDYGYDNWALIPDPTGETAMKRYEAKTYFRNNPFSRTYDSLEVSWQESFNTRLTWGGSYAYTQQQLERDFSGYSDYRSLKVAQGLSDDDISRGGVLSRSQVAKLWATYAHPLAGGRISMGTMVSYATGGIGTYASSEILNKPALDPRYNTDGTVISTPAVGQLTWARRYTPIGAVKTGDDAWSMDVKLEWQIPLGYKKVQLVGDLTVSNIWNHKLQAAPTFGSIGSIGANQLINRLNVQYSAAVPPGSTQEGTANEASYYGGNRSVGSVSVGLRF